MLVHSSFLLQTLRHNIHISQDFLLCQPSSHNLNSNRQPRHLFRIVELVSTLLNPIAGLESLRQDVLLSIDFRHRHNPRTIIQQIPQKRIPATAHRLLHRPMRQRGRRVPRTEDEIELLLLAVPPVEPHLAELLAPRDPLPVLERGQRVEVPQYLGPDGIAPYVFGEEVPDVLYGAGQGHVEMQLGRPGVIGLAGAEEGFEGLAAVGAEEGGRDLQALRRRCIRGEGGDGDGDDGVALGAEGRGGGVQAAGDGGGGVAAAVGAHEADAQGFFVEGCVVGFLTPGDRVDCEIDFPGFHADEGAGKIC